MKKQLLGTIITALVQLFMAPVLAGNYTQADVLFKAAESEDIAENYEVAAKKYHDLIVTLHTTSPGNAKIIRAKARLARIYIIQNHFDQAEPLFYTLVNTDRSKLDAEPELMIDLDDLSDAYLRLQADPHYGDESIKRCLKLRQFINPNHPHLPEAYRLLSQHCASCANTTDAITWLAKAIAIEEHYSPAKQAVLARDKNSLATLYFVTKDLDKAQKNLQESLAIAKRCGAGKRFFVQLYAFLGKIYSLKGNYDQAQKELQLAFDNLEKTDRDYAVMLGTITKYRLENDKLRKKAANSQR